MKDSMQGGQQKNGRGSQRTVKPELHRPVKQEKYQAVPNDVCRQKALNRKSFRQDAPCRRSGHAGNGKGREDPNGGRCTEPLVGQKGVDMKIDARLCK